MGASAHSTGTRRGVSRRARDRRALRARASRRMDGVWEDVSVLYLVTKTIRHRGGKRCAGFQTKCDAEAKK